MVYWSCWSLPRYNLTVQLLSNNFNCLFRLVLNKLSREKRIEVTMPQSILFLCSFSLPKQILILSVAVQTIWNSPNNMIISTTYRKMPTDVSGYLQRLEIHPLYISHSTLPVFNVLHQLYILRSVKMLLLYI
jgi:hypothetical protein